MTSDVKENCLLELKAFIHDPQLFAGISAGKPLLASAAIDSVSLVEIVLRLESRFAVEIDADNIEEVFRDIDTLTAYIDGKIASRPA